MNIEIAGRLADRRKEAGYSQEELAEKLGVSRQAVSKWERSESSPDTNNLIALAKLYDVSLDDLLYVDNSTYDDVAFETKDRAEEQSSTGSSGDTSTSTTDNANSSTDKDDFVRISWKDGIHIKDGTDEVRVGWDGVHITEDGENIVSESGFISFDESGTLQNIGDDVWIYAKNNVWLKFPFPLLALIAYLLIGFLGDQWLLGLSVFITIPLYYTFVNACIKKTPSSILTSLYTIGITAWFFYMGIVESIWHPTWIIFLTIPLFMWLMKAIFKRKPTN